MWFSIQSLRSSNKPEGLDGTLMNPLPTLWHMDHVVHLHTGFYAQIKDRDAWEISKARMANVVRQDKTWILHIRDSLGWLTVFMDWKWMRLSCYSPHLDTDQRRGGILKVGRRFHILIRPR